MEPRLQAADLGFFAALAMAGSLSAAARELRITTAAVSKHLSQMEARLGVPLVNRTTRRMSLTVEGEVLLRHARSILAEMAELDEQLGASRSKPSGLLRVNATLGFGRSHIGPLISRFALQYPEVGSRVAGLFRGCLCRPEHATERGGFWIIRRRRDGIGRDPVVLESPGGDLGLEIRKGALQSLVEPVPEFGKIFPSAMSRLR